MNAESDKTSSEEDEKGLTLWEVFGSVFASFLGVQKREKQERDFKRGKASQFIIVGLVFTIALVLFIYALVQVALNYAGV